MASGLLACSESSSAPLPPPSVPASVAFLRDVDTLLVDGTRQYTVRVLDAQGVVLSGQSVQFSVTPATVATVLPSGMVSAIAPGTAVLTARAGTVQQAMTLVVTALPPTSIAWSVPSGLEIETGEQVAVAAVVRDVKGRVLHEPVTYTTAQPAIATVTAEGTVRAVADGTTTITAQAGSLAAVLTVRVLTTTAALYPTVITTQTGMRGSLWAVLRDAAGQRIPARTAKFESSNPDVMTVSAAGDVEAKSPGNATLRVVLNGTKVATVPVSVAAPPAETHRVIMLYEPDVPAFVRTAGEWTAQRASSLMLSTPPFSPSAADIERANSCTPDQTVQHTGDWKAFHFRVALGAIASGATASAVACVQGLSDFFRPTGFPAVSMARLDRQSVENYTTRAEQGADLYRIVLLHELVHALGIGAAEFYNRGQLDESTGHHVGGGAMTAAQEMGFPTGPIRLSADQSHWDSGLFRREIMNPYSISGGMWVSRITLMALRDQGLPVNDRAADITNAAVLSAGKFGPVDPTAPNPAGPLLAGFRLESPGLRFDHGTLLLTEPRR